MREYVYLLQRSDDTSPVILISVPDPKRGDRSKSLSARRSIKILCSIVITESLNRAGGFPAEQSSLRLEGNEDTRGISSAIHLNAIKQRHVGA